MPPFNEQITLEEVSFGYKRGGKLKPILRNVNLKIDEGEFVSIIGESGSGKTSLLSLLSASIKPQSGEVKIYDKKISSISEKHLSEYRRDIVSTIYQGHNLLEVLTAYQNVELPLLLKKIPSQNRGTIILRILKDLGLADKAFQKPEELSGGEKQRVAIARAIAANSKIILADEPTASLDPETGRSIMEILESINRTNNTTLIVVTHDMSVAQRADRIYRLVEGNIEEIDPIKLSQSLQNQTNISDKIYLEG